MLQKAWVTVAAGALIASGGGSMASGGGAVARENAGFHWTDATIRGTYGIQMQGTNPVPPALGGGIQTVIGVVVRTYDGTGNFTQVDNVKGSVTGIVPDRPGSGTYQVNDDCTGVTFFQPGPGDYARRANRDRQSRAGNSDDCQQSASSDDQHRAKENRPSLKLPSARRASLFRGESGWSHLEDSGWGGGRIPAAMGPERTDRPPPLRTAEVLGPVRRVQARTGFVTHASAAFTAAPESKS